MKILAIILLVFLGLPEELPKAWDKAAKKTVSKSFKGIDMRMERIFVEASADDDRPSPGIVIYELLKERELTGYLILTSAKGRHKYFDYLVIYDINLIIRKVQVFEYRSDHGFEVCNKKWLSQFEGKQGCELVYGEEIDAISGATYSATSITEDLSNLCRFLHKYLK